MIIKITDDEKRIAQLHATVWERTFNVTKENADRRGDIDPNILSTLATFALIIAGEYRRVANTGKIDT